MISETELLVEYEILNFQEEMLNIQVDFQNYAIWTEILLIGWQKVSNIIIPKTNQSLYVILKQGNMRICKNNLNVV